MFREIWKPVPVLGFEEFYEISNFGRVFSVRSGRNLSTRALRNGYPAVNLSVNNQHANCYVHLLVLRSFRGECPEGQEALHGPGGSLDAALANLAWGTHKQNTGPDKQRDHTTARGEQQGAAKLTWALACEIRDRLAAGERGVTLAEELHVSQATISMVRHRRHWAYPPEAW